VGSIRRQSQGNGWDATGKLHLTRGHMVATLTTLVSSEQTSLAGKHLWQEPGSKANWSHEEWLMVN